MNTQLDNPVIREDSEDAKFLEAAALADRGEDIPADLLPSAKTEPETRAAGESDKVQEAKTPDNSEAGTAKAERPRDEKGRFTKTEDGKDIPEAERKPAEPTKEQEQKTESDYERAKKEAKRREITWEKINQTKEEIAQRKAELDAREREITQRTQPHQQQQTRPQDHLPYSSQRLAAAANDFEKRAAETAKAARAALNACDYDRHGELLAQHEKDLENAIIAREQAQKVWQAEAQEAQASREHQLGQAWNANMVSVYKGEIELHNKESALYKRVYDLLGTRRPELMVTDKRNIFEAHPHGFLIAVERAKAEIEAGSASELRESNKKLQAEVDRLNGLTSIGGSGPTSAPTKKKVEDMSEEEQDKWFLAQAALVDSAT